MIDIKSFNDYFSQIKQIYEKLKDDEILCFRGFSNINNGVLPGVFWEKNIDENEGYHSLLLEYPEEFEYKTDHLGTLAKMQHYGVSTRVLDVSGNILVSLYFAACSNKNSNGCVEVFKVRKDEILRHNSDKALMLSCLPCFDKNTKEEIQSFCERNQGRITEDKIKDNDAMIRFLHEVRGEYPAFECAIVGEHLLNSYFVRANKNNQRMKVQDGYFIIAGLDKSRLNDLIRTHLAEKLVIKSEYKEEILKDLKLMNIHDDTIYPDLERTALYMRSRKLAWKDWNE